MVLNCYHHHFKMLEQYHDASDSKNSSRKIPTSKDGIEDKHLRIILKTKREHSGYLYSQFQYLSELPE